MRFGEINAFEAGLAENGVRIVKCFLRSSVDEQRRRLLARLVMGILRDLSPQFSEPEYDVEAERTRLLANDPLR